MPNVEIDESELINLRRVNKVAETIGRNPKARALLQEAVALAAPDEVGPEHRIRSEVTEMFSGVSKKIDDFIDAQTKEREERRAEDAKLALESRWMDGRKKLRDANYTDEGIAAVEKLMEERGIADHEAARALHERINPPPEPVVTGGSRWNFFDRTAEAENDAAMKALLNGNDEEFLRSAIPAALKEVRGG